MWVSSCFCGIDAKTVILADLRILLVFVYRLVKVDLQITAAFLTPKRTMVKNDVVRFVTLVFSQLVLLQSMFFQPVLGIQVMTAVFSNLSRCTSIKFRIDVAFITASI